MSTTAHWDDAYATKGAEGVSWYQTTPARSVGLVQRFAPLDGPVIDVGGGASKLVDDLILNGYQDLTVLDLSGRAFAAAKDRLGVSGDQVQWVVADVLAWAPTRRYVLWHDRAVFHFLVEPARRERYVELAGATVEPGGHLVVATFAADGPEQCSGLPVARYDEAELANVFSALFTVVDAQREEHRTPWGSTQAFTWLVLQRSA